MRIIRASEFNHYLYCQRSWFYKLQGIEPANKLELKTGTEMHYKHGRMVAGSKILQWSGYLFLLIALAIGIYLLVLR